MRCAPLVALALVVAATAWFGVFHFRSQFSLEESPAATQSHHRNASSYRSPPSNPQVGGASSELQKLLRYHYPVHDTIRVEMVAAAFRRVLDTGIGGRPSCSASAFGLNTLLPPAPLQAQPDMDESRSSQLSAHFRYSDASRSTFFRYEGSLKDDGVWWVPNADAALPCTAEVQRALWDMQHPSDCHQAKYLVSRLKQGAHGLGSAVILIAHDLLAAIILKRVLVVESSAWHFASSSACTGRYAGWACFFLAPTACAAPDRPHKVSSLKEAAASKHQVIMKGGYDIPGIGRDDYPSLRAFGDSVLSRTCAAAINEWVGDASNTVLMGTFRGGADPMLVFMLAQAVRYLMRAPQPWFRAMLMHHLPQVGFSTTGWGRRGSATDSVDRPLFPVVYVQDRGEVAKYREYYNVFGCHKVRLSTFASIAVSLCRPFPSCTMYVSGNTPHEGLQLLEEYASGRNLTVLSTWYHTSFRGASTARWGAASPAATWVDLYAGVASTAGACIVQSNWCRLIHLLRLTTARRTCPFVDVGLAVLVLPREREEGCVVNNSWPTKPFSGARRYDATPVASASSNSIVLHE